MKSDNISCEEALRRLSLSEPGVEDHLSHCSACRTEATDLEPLLAALLAEPNLEVPVELDRSIRAMLAGEEPATVRRLNLPVALTLSTAATALLIAGVLMTLSNLYPTGQALVRGVFLVVGYLVLTSVATVPLFLQRSRTQLRTQRWT